MTLPFLAYLGLGTLQAPDSGNIRLRAARSVETRREQGKAVVQVNVTVSNRGPALNRLCLSDPLQPGMRLLDGQLRQPAALRPGEEAALRYTFQAERGIFDWKTLCVQASDPLGLIESRLEVPAPAEVHVPPELRRIRPFPPAGPADAAVRGLDPGPPGRKRHRLLGDPRISPRRPAPAARLAADGPPPAPALHQRIRARGHCRHRPDCGCPGQNELAPRRRQLV